MFEPAQKQKQIKNSYMARAARPGRETPRPVHADNPLLAQQQVLGNQAMQRFGQSCPLKLPRPGICPFGGVCHSCPTKVQAKLTVGQPGDKYEQEADRVADAVIRMPELHIHEAAPVSNQANNDLIQRPCTEYKEELRRQPIEEKEEEEIQMSRSVPDQTPEVTPDVQRQINAIRGGAGQLLPKSVLDFFEQCFGYDFSQVRVHSNAQATNIAKGLNARAFTIGRDVVFGNSQYQPQTPAGRHLLAHELTHVVQQGYHQRKPFRQDEKHENLHSPKYAGSPRLVAAFDNAPHLWIGAREESVRLVQEGVVADRSLMSLSTKPSCDSIQLQPAPNILGSVIAVIYNPIWINLIIHSFFSFSPNDYKIQAAAPKQAAEASKAYTELEKAFEKRNEASAAAIAAVLMAINDTDGSSETEEKEKLINIKSSLSNMQRQTVPLDSFGDVFFDSAVEEEKNDIKSVQLQLGNYNGTKKAQIQKPVLDVLVPSLVYQNKLNNYKRLRQAVKQYLIKENMWDTETDSFQPCGATEEKREKLRAMGKEFWDEENTAQCPPRTCEASEMVTAPQHPMKASDVILEAAMGKLKDKGYHGEGCSSVPYVASAGEKVCTIGIGDQIWEPPCWVIEKATGKRLTQEEQIAKGISKLGCSCTGKVDCKEEAKRAAEANIRSAAGHVHSTVPVSLNQAEFDALVDITLSHGSVPSEVLFAIKTYWCTAEGKNWVRNVYLTSRIHAEGAENISKGLVMRRKGMIWPKESTNL